MKMKLAARRPFVIMILRVRLWPKRFGARGNGGRHGHSVSAEVVWPDHTIGRWAATICTNGLDHLRGGELLLVCSWRAMNLLCSGVMGATALSDYVARERRTLGRPVLVLVEASKRALPEQQQAP
jgi:hypothetical protein